MSGATALSQTGAIVRAQWRATRNRLPRFGGPDWLGAALALLWYAAFVFLAFLAFGFFEQASDAALRESALRGGLLVATLYWQVAPLLLSASGTSLDLKKLLVFPVSRSALFAIDLALRVTTGVEPLIVMTGAAAGLWANPAAPVFGPLWLAAFAVWNLLLSIGVREALARLMRRRLAREAATLLLLMALLLPQLLVSFAPPARVRNVFAVIAALPWPWRVTAVLVSRGFAASAAAALALWLAAAYAFGRVQFARGLRDQDAAAGAVTGGSLRPSLLDRAARFASAPFPDPLGALVEKEIRTLSRSPRFRLTFVMGFTFSIAIWLPMALRNGGDSFIALHFADVVTLYSVLLLGQVLFWNCFGFDRSGAGLYFCAPLRIETVLLAKNLAAALLLSAEITAVLLACAAVRPLSASILAEGYSAGLVFGLFLVAAGNLSSVAQPLPVDPSSLFRNPAGRTTQLAAMVTFPLALAPLALAFLARYALDSAWVFFAVLAIDLGIGLAFYRIATQSAAARALRGRESLVARLSEGSNPVA